MQLELPGLGVAEIELNEQVNQVRRNVDRWRKAGYPNLTPTSRRLIEYWNDSARDNPILFCQIEAAETAIYVAEAAAKSGDVWIRNRLDETNQEFNAGLPRVGLKMATGSGKTVVMAMLIAWQTLNKAAQPVDRRFTKRFLLVTPGITIRDRLRVLLPEDADNYYRQRDLIPTDLYGALSQARIVITNFHTLRPRETRQGSVSQLVKDVLVGDNGAQTPFRETFDQMVSRTCREFGGGGGGILVFNDEAHHCYQDRLGGANGDATPLIGADREEAKERVVRARVWFSGLQAIQRKLGIKTVYDLSATPFFLAGSGYREGDLFPWVVSDFALIDAIESGVVKVPRVPVDDDRPSPDVTYLDLWRRIRDELPRTGRSAGVAIQDPIPIALDGALASLYGSYDREYERWRSSEAAEEGEPPPVFIVVCSNTAVSKMVFDRIAGYEKYLPDGISVLVPGRLALFSNVENGKWVSSPRTILVDSRELESGEKLSPEFKRIAAVEIEEFKGEFARRFPGRSAEMVTDADLLREVLNTVGKRDRLGAGVRCVVSVSMLTEGWDANTVTHILGVRAFSTQLICEQVVGRGLRRRSYATDERGLFTIEYADVYGVPFQFIPTVARTRDLKRRTTRRVRAEPDRSDAEITFPCLTGYRQEFPEGEPYARFDGRSYFQLSKKDLPMVTETAGLVGTSDLQRLDELRRRRSQEVAFRLAARVLERLTDAADPRPLLFPPVLRIVREWLATQVIYHDDTFVGLLLLSEHEQQAVEAIIRGMAWPEATGKTRTVAIFRAYGTVGSTAAVDFFTTKEIYATDPKRCHVNLVVLDGPAGNSWERAAAQSLETHGLVAAYVKNDHLGLTIPYTHAGRARRYLPDFLVRLHDDSDGVPRTLIVEVSGGRKPGTTAAEKAAAARNLWVPAVNSHGGFGLWGYCEVTDLTRLKLEITAAAETLST